MPDGSRANEGPSPPCGGEYAVGRLPRLTRITHTSKTVEYQPGHYGHAHAFWYAVSGNFVNNPISPQTVVNPDTQARLWVDAADDVVAVIIDSGPALPQQIVSRPSRAHSAYLEGGNADGDVHFSVQADGNDMLTFIHKDDLLMRALPRVLAHVRDWLLDYRLQHCLPGTQSGCFPAASASADGACEAALSAGWLAVDVGNCERSLFSSGVLEGVANEQHWFFRNDWARFVRYSVSDDCLGDQAFACDPKIGPIVDGPPWEAHIRIMLADAA
ncbi:MAG TPA: hypothetical protein DD979_02720 [Gammaproteobacteria bacterium]|nr:hypothetical protein [Gammaproteobacteria bacterium]